MRPLLLLLLSLASACSSSPKEPEPSWQVAQVEAPSDRVLWKLSLQALQKMGFPLGAGLDPGAMHAESGWKTDLHPFSGRGQRLLAVMQMEPVERGVWKVEARVKRQLNEELARPLDPRFADWEWGDDDVETARILLQHVRSALAPQIDPTTSSGDPVEDYLLNRQGQP